MSRRTIRWLVVLSALSIIGVLIMQMYWVNRTLELRNRQFNQRVHVALHDVAQQLSQVSGVMQSANPVEQLSPDYFLVNTNATTQPEVLEHYIRESFQKHSLITDFELGIYDCTTDRMRYGMLLSTRNSDKSPATTADWIKTDKYPYYFGIRFPQQENYMAGDLEGWIWSSVIVLIAVSFFSYALFVILRQKQLSEVQRDFINNMTHELQTPISTLRIAADVLNTPTIINQPERHRRYVRIVEEEITRLQRQVEMVLNMAKAERNKLALDLEWLDAHEVIAAISRPYQDRITILLDASSSYIEADRLHFGNLVNNLIDNALKYSPENPKVVVKTSNSGTLFVLEVEDNGIGIAPEFQKKVFQKFYRVPSGNIHNVKGFGIGLSYVQQIVKAHRWKLSLLSSEQTGSRFTIQMPHK
ncbi:sensor histidine kinase [Arundinibacter roseus]|uniref:histidine kinase n=1 Tax=Arundinibacter roseus TaxID=2070510 RepID=A0A4R4KMK4_9BACT|nr:HAMP domain-containing sensor histidine kinase [Arundinibacter roseus]TDB69233.1 HAMP domain-containing histidine kinase [Arundinibacter roseus]